ncbi:unnamed protein product, partial [Ectocarpus fasciculatus]
MCPVTGDEEQASLDKCVHAFHFTCIVKWGETTNQCPMCKVTLTPPPPHYELPWSSKKFGH